MAIFFNGRLWTSPATMSVVDDSAMANQNLSVGNAIALVGPSDGGEPNKALKFGSPSEARAVLRSGMLLKAVEKAFDPSPQTNGPSLVVAIRVNPALQAGLALADVGASNVIDLKSTDYGLYTNQLKVKIESGSISGKKLTTQLGDDYFNTDNVGRNAFSIQYAGAELTAVMTVDNATVTLEAPALTAAATIDLSVYDTVQKLVDYINTVADFSALVLDGNGEKAALNGLDSVTSQDVLAAAFTATADLQAIVDWFNGLGEGYVTAARVAAAGTVPANLAFTYLAGGSDGVTTSTDWSNAFTELQGEDVQWVVPISSDASIHAMADSHAAYMSNIARMERRCLVGGASAQTQDEVIAAALALNSDRTSQCYPGYYDYDDNGDLILYPSYMTAVLVGAAFSGSNPGEPMTNKALKVRGLETKLRNPTDTDDLIKGGVLCVEETAKGYKVVQSITTWLNNANYNRVEVSTGFATDFVARNVREAIDTLRGKKAKPLTLSEAVSRTDTILRQLAREEPAGPEVIVGDADNPAYKNIKATLEGDVIRVEFQCSPVIPNNYQPVTIHAVPFSGSASV